MIPPLIFSLLAFFVVITTTVVVIKNKSKVSSINKSFNTTKQKIANDKHTNEKKLQSLVHEINFNNEKLENSQNNTKKELKLENRKTNEKMSNLDKRFNSYKNITTANLMGINNRMTSENERLQEEIELNKEIIDQNRRIHSAGINSNALEISNANTSFNNFIRDDYNPAIASLERNHTNAVEDISTLRSNLLGSVIDSSNINLDARILIRDDVISKYNRVNDSLTNFFNVGNDQIPFVENNYTRTDNDKLFSNWYDNYYNISSYSNFKKMDQLLLAADQDMNALRVERNRTDRLEDRAGSIESNLSPETNLYKNNLATFINSEYNFNLQNLTNIQDNTQEITALSGEVTTLSNLLKEISLIDATGSVITLDALNSNIQENARKITDNETAIDVKFNTDFGKYLGSNLGDHYQTIADNLNETTLKNKISNKNHVFRSVTASNISTNILESEKDIIFGGDLKFGETSYRDKIDNNENYTKTLNQIFGYNQVANKQHILGSEITTDPMIKFIKPATISSTGIPDTTLNLSKVVDLQPGVDISLKRKVKDGTTSKVGGKIFVDTWDDIGLNKYHPEYTNVIDNDLVLNHSVPGDTLGDKFININDQLAAMSNDLSGFTAQQQNGMIKNQLYNVLNQSGTYGTDGRGDFKDLYKNSMRVKHLYTGEPGTVGYECINDVNEIIDHSNKQCKTVDDRLNDLESVQTAAFGVNFDTEMERYGLALPVSSVIDINLEKNLNAKENVFVHGNLSVAGDVDVTGNLNVGVANTGKLVLGQINDIEIKNPDVALPNAPFEDYFLRRNRTPASDNDNYIESISATADLTGFEYKMSSSDSPTTITFPTSSNITVSEGDIKTFAASTNAVNLLGGSTGDISRFSYTTYGSPTSSSFDVPNKYVYSISDNPEDGTFTVTQKDNNSDLDSTLVIDKGVSTRDAIIDKLKGVADEGEAIPNFEKGIKFGAQGCIKMSDNKILACDSSCQVCVHVWDHAAAPEP